MSESLRPHGRQQAMLPCPSLSLKVCGLIKVWLKVVKEVKCIHMQVHLKVHKRSGSLDSFCCCCCYVTSDVSDSVWPDRLQPTRPWDSPGKNTGVGCHFLLQCMKVKSESEVAQSCPTLCDPMDCSLPGSSIHGIFQARVLEWGAIAFSIWIARDS